MVPWSSYYIMRRVTIESAQTRFQKYLTYVVIGDYTDKYMKQEHSLNKYNFLFCGAKFLQKLINDNVVCPKLLNCTMSWYAILLLLANVISTYVVLYIFFACNDYLSAAWLLIVIIIIINIQLLNMANILHTLRIHIYESKIWQCALFRRQTHFV